MTNDTELGAGELAAAWDEGYARGVRDEASELEPADNPYRAGCYICRPDDPNANPEGCANCDREYWAEIQKRICTYPYRGIKSCTRPRGHEGLHGYAGVFWS